MNCPWDVVIWSGAYLLRTRALKALARPLPDSEKGGKLADVSFTDRLIPASEHRLVSTCILWPDIRLKIMQLPTGGGHTGGQTNQVPLCRVVGFAYKRAPFVSRNGAEGRIRTGTGLSSQRFLSSPSVVNRRFQTTTNVHHSAR